MSLSLQRRSFLAGAASLPLAGAVTPVLAASERARAALPISRSFKLGAMTVTTLLDGSTERPNPKELFGQSASDEEFAALSEENFIPTDRIQLNFTPTIVETGSEVVLFDTGLGQGGIQKALADAGFSAEEVDVVVITHMHPDHIGGMMSDGTATFPNARYVTAAQEYNFWSAMDAGNRVGDMVSNLVTPLAEKMSFVEDGGAVVSGMTALASFGHTPGHMCYMLESEGAQLVITADLANHYVWSFARPDWAFGFDGDADVAAASRKKILGMLAADRVPMIGYHMPFPGAGFVETRGDGFRYVPVSYQMMG